jgi:hypothetical protein
MTAFAHQIIRDALAIRLRKATGTVQCMCCKGMLDPEDFRPDLFADATEMAEWFSGPVCFGCMDDLVKTEDTGAWLLRKDAIQDWRGDWWQEPPDGYDIDDRTYE